MQPLLRQSLLVFDLSAGLMLRSRRSLVLALLAAGGVLLAVAIRAALMGRPSAAGHMADAGIGGAALFGTLAWLVYVRFLVPLAGVFYGTALVADEVEDGTITYLFVRPISRSAVLLGKYASYLACASLVAAPSVVLVYFATAPADGSLGRSFPLLLAVLGVVLAGLVTYGALFAWVGARVRHPLVAGLVFIFGWEPAALFLPGAFRQLTVAYYLQAFLPHAATPGSAADAIARWLGGESPSPAAAATALGVLTLGSLWLATRSVRTREYPVHE